MTRFVMPPEWAPHTRTWMSWPCAELTFGDTLPQARAEFADVARAIARFEPLSMLFDPDNCEGVEALRGVPNIDLVECPLDDSWLRDNGPTFVVGMMARLRVWTGCLTVGGPVGRTPRTPKWPPV